MIGKRMMQHVNIWPRVLLMAFLLLLLGSLHPVQAQVTLSLSPSTTAATQGSTIQFMLDLTGGANLAGYTTSISVDTGSLTFVNNSPPFTSTFSGANQFSLVLSPPSITTSGTTQTLNIQFLSGTSDAPVNNSGQTTELGFFSVLVGSSAPLGTASVTLAPVETTGDPSSPSSVQDSDGNNVLTDVSSSTVAIAAAPEPAQSATLGLLALGLGGLLWRARKRRKMETP